MASTFSSTPKIGVSFTRRTTDPEHGLGTPVLGDKNDTWVYVVATETVATGTCTVDASFNLTDAAGDYTADTAFASGEYGWVRKTTSPL
jgi:hypothetical protein